MKIIFYVLIFIMCSLSSGSGLILIKLSLNETQLTFYNILKIISSPKFLSGFSLYILGFILWMYILSRVQVNIAYPIIVSLLFIVILLGSHFILKEQFSAQLVLGILLCFLGILLIILK